MYVSSGYYETDIEISLPTVFPESICSVSLWLNGSQIEGSKSTDFVLADTPKYTFKNIKSSNKTETYVVKIKGENSSSQDYLTIEVDYTKQKNNVRIISTNTFSGPSTPDSTDSSVAEP